VTAKAERHSHPRAATGILHAPQEAHLASVLIKPVALLCKADVNAKCLNDRPSTKHRCFSSQEENLDLAELTFQKHRKSNGPVAPTLTITSEMELAADSMKLQQVLRVSKLNQVLDVPLEGTIAAKKSRSTGAHHSAIHSFLAEDVHKDHHGLVMLCHGFGRR